MKNQNKILINLFAILFVSALSTPVFAYQPLVVCGNEDSAGSTELDNVTVFRGGNPENQLVIRNTNIINDFVAKGAIYRGELNSKGEFIIEGLGSEMRINNRLFTLVGSNNNYTLTVRLVAGDGVSLSAPIASFYFNGDCQSF